MSTAAFRAEMHRTASDLQTTGPRFRRRDPEASGARTVRAALRARPADVRVRGAEAMKQYLKGIYDGPGDPADGSAKRTDARSLACGDGVLRAVIEAAEFI